MGGRGKGDGGGGRGEGEYSHSSCQRLVPLLVHPPISDFLNNAPPRGKSI